MLTVAPTLTATSQVFGFLAVFLGCLILLAWLYFLDTEEDNALVRLFLRHRLQRLPLHRMLVALDREPQQHARELPVPQLRRQLRRCQACARRDGCAPHQALSAALASCPNRDELLPLVAD